MSIPISMTTPDIHTSFSPEPQRSPIADRPVPDAPATTNPDARKSENPEYCNQCHTCGTPLPWWLNQNTDEKDSYRPWAEADYQEYGFRPTFMLPHPNRYGLRFSNLGNGVELCNNEVARMIALLQAGYRFDVDDFKQAILSLAVMVNFPSLTPNPVDPAFPPQPEVSVPFPLRCGQPIPTCFIPSRLNPESPVFRPASVETSGAVIQISLMRNEESVEDTQIVEHADNGSSKADEVQNREEHGSEEQDNGAESGEGKADTEKITDTEPSDGETDNAGVMLAEKENEEIEKVQEREERMEGKWTDALVNGVAEVDFSRREK